QRSITDEGLSLSEAVAARVRQHPLLEPRIKAVKKDSEYTFFPPTQYAFHADAYFSGLKVGRHGFILNGDQEPEPFPDKSPGLVRIVLLGGSSAGGATATANDKTPAARLEGLLNRDAGPGGRFQVLNFGMGGNYTFGEVTRLINEVAYLEPDVVIMFDGFNDALYANLEHLRAGLDRPLINWADFSYHYFDAMNRLRGTLRPPPVVMTYSYLLMQSLMGQGGSESIATRRQAIYEALPAHGLAAWVAAEDPRFRSVLQTNLDFAAAWAARRGIGFFAYLQPHPWEYKDLSCERAAETKLMIGRLGPTMDEARYSEIMRTAFQGYAQVYDELDAAYGDAPRVRFIDLRRLFENNEDCVYNDPIHYNDAANLAIAERMLGDLAAGGVVPSQ
ncbi:MAG: SGNH/GDSL hydrolase family protein, partial [Gammaproteobacteria bacterium]